MNNNNNDDGPPFKRQKQQDDMDDNHSEDDGVTYHASNKENDTSMVVHSQFDDTVTKDGGGIRSSTLPSPTMALTGHKGSVYSLQYSPSGDILCSTSFDMTCLLWDHTNGYDNFNILRGHTNAVLDCSWCDDETVVTVSADKTVQLWDITTGQRLRKWAGQHTGIVNTCSTAPNGTSIHTIASGSDDGTCRIWDRRQKQAAAVLETDYPILAVAVTSLDTTSNPQVFTAGIHNQITCWDIRQHRKIYAMKGHSDTITCLAIQPTHQTHLFSNSMDHTLQIWDIQPFVASSKNRHVKTFTGHQHNSERGLLKCSWSSDASMVSGGSADRMVHIWDEYTTEELYLLPGHKGCVNTVSFHPKESNVVASGGSDNMIYVGELS